MKIQRLPRVRLANPQRDRTTPMNDSRVILLRPGDVVECKAIGCAWKDERRKLGKHWKEAHE